MVIRLFILQSYNYPLKKLKGAFPFTINNKDHLKKWTIVATQRDFHLQQPF
jgi:hypothetical protein